MFFKKYKIKSLLNFVRDEKSVKFHIKSDDYFGTIATVLSLIKQQIKKDACKNADILSQTLNNIEKDLMFLQNNYQINPKIKNKNSIPNGKLNNQ
jgi:hypothetical protein